MSFVCYEFKCMRSASDTILHSSNLKKLIIEIHRAYGDIQNIFFRKFITCIKREKQEKEFLDELKKEQQQSDEWIETRKSGLKVPKRTSNGIESMRRERERTKDTVIANNMKLMSKDYASIVNSMFFESLNSQRCTYKFDPLFSCNKTHEKALSRGQTVHLRASILDAKRVH